MPTVPHPPAFWPGLWRVTALEMSAPWTGTFHEPEGIVNTTHCFEVRPWRGEGNAGRRAQPRRNGETPPLKPREPKGWLLCRYMDMGFRAGNLFFVLLFVLL